VDERKQFFRIDLSLSIFFKTKVHSRVCIIFSSTDFLKRKIEIGVNTKETRNGSDSFSTPALQQ
jgi:hypothetical protein